MMTWPISLQILIKIQRASYQAASHVKALTNKTSHSKFIWLSRLVAKQNCCGWIPSLWIITPLPKRQSYISVVVGLFWKSENEDSNVMAYIMLMKDHYGHNKKGQSSFKLPQALEDRISEMALYYWKKLRMMNNLILICLNFMYTKKFLTVWINVCFFVQRCIINCI